MNHLIALSVAWTRKPVHDGNADSVAMRYSTRSNSARQADLLVLHSAALAAPPRVHAGCAGAKKSGFIITIMT
ncbi:hypothetical protein EXIGLDRAFT_208998 [Exidia glandulosa HHB12029]|uniref:Uncharacterized protein n=1 Tax=Exidia glandulosa HHB12029 TaxID=1314781 RepID=A0A165EKK7_EXIGL|nr:hypothetical protein EXIGLDRAFT_208998 [Exidia glandulosa HHB12029]